MKQDKGLKLKDRYRNLSKKQKLVVWSILSILLMGTFVTAYYIFSHTASTSFVISSDETISFSDDFEMVMEMDLTSSEIVGESVINMTNLDGSLEALFEFDTIIDDEVDGCDNTGDVVINATYDGTELVDDDLFDIFPGDSNIILKYNIKRYSCPQNVSSTITITA